MLQFFVDDRISGEEIFNIEKIERKILNVVSWSIEKSSR